MFAFRFPALLLPFQTRRCRSDSHRLVLAAGAVRSFTPLPGERIVCLRGRVLLTQSGRNEDFDLGAGDALLMLGGRLTVVEADSPSVLEFHADRQPCEAGLQSPRKICSSWFR